MRRTTRVVPRATRLALVTAIIDKQAQQYNAFAASYDSIAAQAKCRIGTSNRGMPRAKLDATCRDTTMKRFTSLISLAILSATLLMSCTGVAPTAGYNDKSDRAPGCSAQPNRPWCK